MTPFHRASRQAFTPLITPFQNNGIAFDALEAAIDRQIVAGMDGIVVGDVVGEGPTLSDDERDALMRTCIERGKRHLSVIAAAGTYCTQTTIERSLRAQALGADALLITVPYYSKPTVKGVVGHFRQIAAAVSIPVIVDDNPGRTAKDFGSELLEGLIDYQIITGVCHGADRLAYFSALPKHLRARFIHLTRDDATLCRFIELGGDGAMSPIANVIASPMQTVISLGSSTSGGFASLTETITAAIAAVGTEDVAALKEAMSFIHQSPADVRLPLVACEPETIIRIRHALAPFARCEEKVRAAA